MISLVFWCTLALWGAFFQLRRVVIILASCLYWVSQLLVCIPHGWLVCWHENLSLSSDLDRSWLMNWIIWRSDDCFCSWCWSDSSLFLSLILVIFLLFVGGSFLNGGLHVVFLSTKGRKEAINSVVETNLFYECYNSRQCCRN